MILSCYIGDFKPISTKNLGCVREFVVALVEVKLKRVYDDAVRASKHVHLTNGMPRPGMRRKARMGRYLIVLACLGAPVAQLLAAAADTRPAISTKKVAVFRLHGSIRESPKAFAFSLSMSDRRTLYELVQRLGKAARDPDVAAVAFFLDEPSLGWAQVQELRAAGGRLRSSGKEVHCHLATADERGYMVAAACNRISLVPSGDVSIIGLAAEGLYFKGLLDKLGIVADMEHCGAYKASGEPYTRTGPSKEVQEQMQSLLGDLFEQMVEAIAQSRGLTPERVRELIDRGPLPARHAAGARLVDDLSYRDEFVRDLQRRFPEAELIGNYGRQKSPELDLASPFAFFKLLKDAMEPTKKRGKNEIALVYLDGIIMTGTNEESFFDELISGSTTIRRALLEAADDENIKAVVLRVDSPGGSALASDLIYQAVQVVRKAKKPVVVSMGDTAASGGYYVASGADFVFAEPGTITGSIGVIGGKIALGGLFEKIGITTYTHKFGRHADLFALSRPFDEHQRKVIRDLMTETYDQFKRCVTNGRGDRLKGDIENLAGGRVYTGRQSLQKGLIDRLGGINEAILHAAGQAQLADYQVRILPKPKVFFEYILQALGLAPEEEDDEGSQKAEFGRLGWYRTDTSLSQAIPLLSRLAPAQTRAVVRMLFRIELLRREPVLMVTPQEWLIR